MAAQSDEVRQIGLLVFEIPEAYELWLDTPVPAFRGRTPRIELSRGRRGKERVLGILHSIYSGTFS